jgi:hypothetical protein
MIDPKAFLAQHADKLGPKRAPRFGLTDDMKAIIDLVVEERRAGKHYSLTALHRVMREEFDLSIGVRQFRAVVMEHTDGQW